MKPPISYYGGKQRIASRIVELLPPHTVYVEPFCGGAAVMFAKGLPKITSSAHYREVLNDHDQRLINFYRVLQNAEQRAELFERLDNTLYSRAEYEKAREHEYGSNAIDDAWSYFVSISCSFSNIFNDYFGSATYGRELATTFKIKIDAIANFRDRLTCTTIENDEALKIIKRYDRQWTCFYCDPPYPDTNQARYSGYTQADFENLVKTLENCKGSVVLSHYPNEAVDPGKWQQHKIKAVCSSQNPASKGYCDKSRTEVVSIIDRHASVETARPELWPVLWSPSQGKLYGEDKRSNQMELFD